MFCSSPPLAGHPGRRLRPSRTSQKVMNLVNASAYICFLAFLVCLRFFVTFSCSLRFPHTGWPAGAAPCLHRLPLLMPRGRPQGANFRRVTPFHPKRPHELPKTAEKTRQREDQATQTNQTNEAKQQNQQNTKTKPQQLNQPLQANQTNPTQPTQPNQPDLTNQTNRPNQTKPTNPN